MRLLRFVFLALTILIVWPAQAMQGLFWQPQKADLSIHQDTWSALMQTIKDRGFDTLILQWTQHDTSFDDKDEQRLQAFARAASQAGLKLIVGLYADSGFFARQQQSGRALESYLRGLRSQDVDQAQRWTNTDLPIDGWYVSAELDDRNWRRSAQQKQLRTWLFETRRSLQEVRDIPVYISSFFAGNMALEAYADLIKTVRLLGYQVWIQDGGGTGVLTHAQRTLYLKASVECLARRPDLASGVIYELFTVAASEPFRAHAKSDAVIAQLLEPQVGCPDQRLYFSLRYLPESRQAFAR